MSSQIDAWPFTILGAALWYDDLLNQRRQRNRISIMKIHVDADACPNVIKEILFRVAKRLGLITIFYANHDITVARHPCIKKVRVLGGFDVADQAIVDAVQVGDLVITADIPLASAVIDKGAHALNPRGEMYTVDNIKDRLAIRHLMDGLRQEGKISGGPPPLNQRDQMIFANALDRFLAKNK